MGDRGDVGDGPHLYPSCLKRADSRLAPWARPLNEDIKLPNPMLHRLPGRQMSSHLGSIGRALPRALKTRCPSTPPSDGVALLVGDGDYSVIESSLNVRLRVRDVLALPPPLPTSALPPWHSKPPLTRSLSVFRRRSAFLSIMHSLISFGETSHYSQSDRR